MKVDQCGSSCIRFGAPLGSSEFLNINSPLQIGGTVTDLDKIGDLFNWTYIPTSQGFAGCIKNLKINGIVSIFRIINIVK